jgi:glycosyltransferase involved in cell wall biosynthesis
MKIGIVANTTWYLYNFRLNLAKALRAEGHEPVFIGPADDYVARLQAAGFGHRHWPVSPAGKNPASEIRTVAALRRIFRDEKLDAVLSYTPKGNIYSGLAMLGRPGALLPNISGLGGVFSTGGPLAALVRRLYHLAISRRAAHVFFQNEDDMAQFVEAGIIEPGRAERLMGSGVDLQRFALRPLPSAVDGNPGAAVTFLLVARMIPEKGIAEYVAAARALRDQGANARFQLLGATAEGRGLSAAQIRAWHDEGVIEYLGTSDDVPAVMAQADCLVLPSYYREGVPRSLIEGAAMGRPVITTDMPGCRDVVRPGVSGWLCRPRSVESLRQALQEFLDMPTAQRSLMGAEGRERAVRLFDESAIIDRYAGALRQHTKVIHTAGNA